MNDDVLSLDEAAQYLRLDLSVVVRLARQRKIAHTKTGRTVTFRREALEQYQLDHETASLPANPHGLTDASLRRVRGAA